MELYEKKINSKQIFDGVVVKLFVDDIELPNGKPSKREVVRHPGAVCVLPIDDCGNAIMVKQFRYPFSDVLLEVPAGKLEKDEDPYDAVIRELEEETGAKAKTVEYIGSVYTTVAFTDEKIYMYLATGITFKEAHPDEDEFVEVVKMPFDELYQRVMSGELTDAKTVAATLKTKLLLDAEQ